MSDPLTDVSRPSALPVAHLSNKRDPHAQSLIEQDSKTYLDNIEEEWNRRVDAEIETLVDGMVDLVGLASVRPLSLVKGKANDDALGRLGTRTNSVSLKNPFKLNPGRNPWSELPIPSCPSRIP